ncbi:hypothetical protein JTE90_024515 [Oedothorax gibbosus]|uniref:NADP-dependent oxidoreductase domain-containing protein n=1 Tax=Oedothorax gibbosus TaxID=931172 RepID=A0AAV6TWE3_9ARAC|nr:hypothetical protein JTE90_024515 [Oedothorax gibbosus]
MDYKDSSITGKFSDTEKENIFSEESSILLSSGYRMPIIGLGSSLVTDGGTLEASMTAAVEIGYRHFDTAFTYHNEKQIGNALTKLMESGSVKREEIFVVSKLPQNGMKGESVEYFCKKSLENLGLDYIDLYLIHSPMATKRSKDDQEHVPFKDGLVDYEIVDLVDTWQAMESLVNKGYVRSVGLSNFNSEQTKRVYDAARIKPANLQVECHTYFPQYELFDYCKKLNISMTAYCPLGCPHLQEFMLENNGMDLKAPTLLENEVVAQIGRKYNKTPAQILLRYLVQRGIAVIPRSKNPKRLKENFEVFDFSLEDEDMNLLKSIQNGFRYVKLDYWKGMVDHPEYPYYIPF